MKRILEALVPARLGRDFRWLFGASWATNIGDGLAVAAGPLLMASQTQDAGLVAMALLVQRLPYLVFSLYAGVMVDRWDRRLVVIVVNLLRALVLVVLAVLIAGGQVNPGVVLAALFLLGTAEVFADITKSALLPMMVPHSELGTANARMVTAFQTANQLVGPPIGAFLFAVGMAIPFGVQAVAMALGAVLISRIARTPGMGASARSAVVGELKAGVKWLWNHSSLRILAITVFVFNITFGAAWSVLVLVAIERFQIGEVGYGVMIAVGAVGGIFGAVAYGGLERRFGMANIMRAGLIVECATHLVLATTTWPVLGMTMLFLFGVHNSLWATTTTTIRQRVVPSNMLGRVSSVNQLGSYGGMVLGAAIGGVIASQWGVAAPFWFAFVGASLTLVLIWRQLSQIALVGGDVP